METLFIIVITAIIAYLIGSVPTAVWYGKAFHGIDVRDHGSGNAGATNTFRVLGKKPGIVVMSVDIAKGWLATYAANIITEHLHLVSTDHLIFLQILFGVLAVVGHIFPVYVGFKGGKGVATLFGMVLAIHVYAALICTLVFLVVFIISKYVSLGSMIAALTFPIVLLLRFFGPEEPILIGFGFAIFAIVILTHQKNIIRLLNGEENKAKIKIRRKS